MGNYCFYNIKDGNPHQLETPNSNIEIDQTNLAITDDKKIIKANTKKDNNLNRNIGKKKHIKSKVNDIPEMAEDYEKSVLTIIQQHNRKGEDEELIENCLLKHFFMSGLERLARVQIIKEMSLCSVKENTYIFKIGGTGNYFYIIKKGQVREINSNNMSSTILKEGDSFGELALLYDAPRSRHVLTVTECYFWVLERKNFRKIVDHIMKLNFTENKNFIENIPVLANLDNDQKSILCNSLYKEHFEEGKFIFHKDEPANCLYFVKEGEIDCVLNGKVVRTLQKGDNFGERAILVDSKRSLDVIAKTESVCYSLSIFTLNKMLGNNYRKLLFLNFIKSSFKKGKFLNKFNLKLLDKCFDLFTSMNLDKSQMAFNSGYEKNNKIVVVIDGTLINNETGEVVANRGDILFEKELLENSQEKINYHIRPFFDCLLIQAETNKVLQLLGGSFKKLIGQGSMISSLLQLPILRSLSQNKLEILAQRIGLENYKDGENIITQGEEGDKFYIIKSGKVDIYVGPKYIRTLSSKECFGERALFFNEKRSATIKSVGDCSVYFISKSDFENIIEQNMKDHLMNRLYLQDNTVELKDLLFCKELGSGNYGKVSLVKNLKNNFFYAIKSLSRKQINYEQLHPNLLLERQILLQIDHPFIVKLVKTLKDSKRIYFLMEYIKGKELFDVIRDIGILSKAQAQFYGASMLISIEYLHNRHFIYRDIKPENIIVIKNGYIKLIDFGTAKEIEDRTFTVIGTPHYTAPEILLGNGYSFNVDIWSIAICIYEFICGGVPFGENAEDPMDVYAEIVNNKLVFPNFCTDYEFKSFMKQMLNKDPISRLSNLDQIKAHYWFNDFNWEDLVSMKLNAPYLPVLQEDQIKNPMPYLSYLTKHTTDWTNQDKNNIISQEKLKEYDEWFDKF